MNRRLILVLSSILMFCLFVNLWHKKNAVSSNELSIINKELSVEDINKHKHIVDNILTLEDNGLKIIEAIHGEVELDQIEKGIKDANSYLLQTIDEHGKFKYRYNLNPEVKVSQRYNMLRHAGAIYSLVMHEQIFGTGENISSIVRASNFLKSTSLKQAGEKNMLGIWSYDHITGSGDEDQVKLGGAGLSLVALLSTEKIASGTTSMEEFRALGDFILYMQKMDGSFYSKYIPSKGGRNDNWTSLYYPGEAALGLVMLYEYDRNVKWLEGAIKALLYLSKSRYTKEKVEADHWALLATARAYPFIDQLDIPSKMLERALMDHAIQICGSMLSEGRNNLIKDGQIGCFSPDGRTTPTATRLEGLQAALSILPSEKTVLRDRILSAVNLGTLFLLKAQLKEGEHIGAILRGTRQIKIETQTSTIRTLNRRQTEFRIDYVQHALSAFIQYHQRTTLKQ